MTTPDEKNEGSNQPDRDALIAECVEGMDEIDAARRVLNGKAGKFRERLNDAGIQVRAFEFSRKLNKMEVEARGSYLADLKISMAAMGIGEQGNFFQAGPDESEDAAAEANDSATGE